MSDIVDVVDIVTIATIERKRIVDQIENQIVLSVVKSRIQWT